MKPSRNAKIAALNAAIIVPALMLFIILNNRSIALREYPPAGEIKVFSVDAQRDVYAVYKHTGVWGAHHVHLNRDFNMLDYFPKEEKKSRPFPIRTYDIRPYYEKGVDSHTWLFVATRTGMVRRITTVVPNRVFAMKQTDLASNYLFRVRQDAIDAYSYDTPWKIVPLRGMQRISEPVIVSVDTGFFDDDVDPLRVADVLRKKCADIRMLILVTSLDEERTARMHSALHAFARFFLEAS